MQYSRSSFFNQSVSQSVNGFTFCFVFASLRAVEDLMRFFQVLSWLQQRMVDTVYCWSY